MNKLWVKPYQMIGIKLHVLCLVATEETWLSLREISMRVAEKTMEKVIQQLQRALEAKQLGLLSVEALV